MDISTITDAFGDVMLMQPSAGVFVAAVLAAILLGMSAFASGSEIAFFSLSPTDVAELEDEKTDADKKIQMLRDDSERTLATIFITYLAEKRNSCRKDYTEGKSCVEC